MISLRAKRVMATAAVILVAAAGLGGCGHMHMGGGSKRLASQPTPTIGVNAYLWRATLDTLSFMPIVTADPWGGTVITDWYANPEKPDERFKVTVYILDTRLRADGLKVTVNKRVPGAGGAWVDVAPSEQTETDLQNSILTRARQLRLSNINDRG